MDALAQFLQTADLGQPQVRLCLSHTQSALDAVPEDDPSYALLAAIEEDLQGGSWPEARLRRLAERLPQPVLAVQSIDLESEFRKLAGQLDDGEWQTTTYQELLDHLDADEDDQLYAYLGKRRKELEAARQAYTEMGLTAHEVTAETVAGHRLLLDGIQLWLEGVTELLRSFDGEDVDEDGALETVERGNRLLVAVQRLNQRVVAQTRQK